MIKIMRRSEVALEDILIRTTEGATSEKIESAVAEILENIRINGDQAVLGYTAQFDGVKLDCLRVTEDEINTAYDNMDTYFIETLNQAAQNIRGFHEKQVHNDFSISQQAGVVMGQKYTPIEKVGIYVPGGTASYPSTVLMNAIPAKIAGVSQIIMVTPPNRDGSIPAAILAAAKIAGVTDIFKMGGAQAVGALAYGTQSVPKVDKIVGPGNIFVATAKRRVFGLVAIDMIAGPSEILVLADSTANPKFIAADLLSQAEHDKMASAVLVCDDMKLAQAVQGELEIQIPQLPRGDIARVSIDNNGKIIVAEDLKEGIEISNAIAPEHLELCVDDPFALLPAIQNAGSIFMGKHVPEAMGDYFAGPNHTLPTSGTARFSSPLSVDDFVKKSSYLYYTREALGEVCDRVVDFAHREGLDGHGRSIAIRFEEESQ